VFQQASFMFARTKTILPWLRTWFYSPLHPWLYQLSLNLLIWKGKILFK